MVPVACERAQGYVDNQGMNSTLQRPAGEVAFGRQKACVLSLALVAGLAGCSPALNWRSISVPEADLNVMLPCKPDEARRTVELAGAATELAMVGCEADGAVFAVSYTTVADPALVGKALAHWRAAVIANLRPQDSVTGRVPATDAPFTPHGALALPQSVRTVVQGQRPDGSAVMAQAVWFARASGSRIRLYHAVVYTAKPRTELADQFFAGLLLPQV